MKIHAITFVAASVFCFTAETKNLNNVDGLSVSGSEDDCIYLAQFPIWTGTCTWGEYEVKYT